MHSKLLLKKAVTSGITLALVATYSLVALANSGKSVGELVVTGSNNGTFVTVNGEPAKSGRSVFSSSTITTPAEFGAIVNLGRAGKIELAAKSTFVVSFDDASISGELTSGSVTVLNAAGEVQVKTLADVVTLNAGETAAAESAKSSKQTKSGGSHVSAGLLAAIFGGIVVAAVLLTNKGNNNTLSNQTVTISPVR